MKNSSNKVLYLAQAAMIAAIYVVLTVVGASLAFGEVQIRFAEALTILPVLRSLSTRRKLRKNMVKQQIQGYLFNKSTKYGERRCA